MKKKEIFVLLAIGVATSIIGGLILSYSKPITLGVISMLHETLHVSVDFLWIPLSIAICVLLFAVITWKYWISSLNRYDYLYEKTKLTKTFDRALSVEINPKWYTSKQVIAKNPGDKFPHLYFDIRVVNRTYHSFDEPEEIAIRCFNGWGDMKEEVCTDTWDKRIGDSTMIEQVSKLGKFDDGTFVFHCPIKKLYGDLEKWKLQGTVKYKSKETLIGEDNQYANPEIGIKLKYALSEKRISYLKKLIEEALRDNEK